MAVPHSVLTFLSIVARVESLATEESPVGYYDDFFPWEDRYQRGMAWPVTPFRSRRKSLANQENPK